MKQRVQPKKLSARTVSREMLRGAIRTYGGMDRDPNDRTGEWNVWWHESESKYLPDTELLLYGGEVPATLTVRLDKVTGSGVLILYAYEFNSAGEPRRKYLLNLQDSIVRNTRRFILYARGPVRTGTAYGSARIQLPNQFILEKQQKNRR